MKDFEELEKEYFIEKEIHETRLVITSFICPVCGARLHGYVGSGTGDCLEFKAYIECHTCNMFHAESRTHSNYEKGNYRNDALLDVMEKVKPYIKMFGEPLETV